MRRAGERDDSQQETGSVGIDIREGAAVADESILTVELAARLESDHKAAYLKLEISFLKAEIPRSSNFRVLLFAACRSASFSVRSVTSTISEYTQTGEVKAKHSVSSSTGSSASVKGVGKKSASERTTEFRGIAQPEIQATRVGPSEIRWSVDMSREERNVRDFLEGNISLFARARLDPPFRDIITWRAKPNDVRIFDKDLKPLSGVMGAALYAFVELSGNLREYGEAELQVTVDEVSDSGIRLTC